MGETPPGRFWVIRHPTSGGAIVARGDTNTDADLIPDVIADSDDFVIQSVADRSALKDTSIDHSGLNEEEKRLLDSLYPAR